MRPARREIHVLACHLPVLKPRINDGHCLVEVLDGDLHEVFHKNFPKLLPNLEVSVRWIEQILNLLLVDLEKGEMHLPVQEARVGACLLFEKSEDEIERGGYDALTLKVYLVQNSHRVGLARSSLTINEVATMVAIQDMKYQWERTLLEHLHLRRLVSEDLCVLEISLDSFREIMKADPAWRCSLHTAPQRYLGVIMPIILRILAICFLIDFMSEGWAHPHKDLYRFLFHQVIALWCACNA